MTLQTWRTARHCRRHDIPYILTPRRQLEPWHIANCNRLCRLPLLLLWRSMVRHAKAIRTTTAQEQHNLLRLTLLGHVGKPDNPWNANVVTIFERTAADNNIGNTGQNSDTAGGTAVMDSLDTLRRKVVDTNPFLCMTDDEMAIENRLLRAGIDSHHNTGNTREPLPTVSTETWRKIQLHAADEGVLDIIAPAGPMIHADRFAKTTKKDITPLPRDHALTMPLHLDEVCDEEKASTEDTLVCTMLLNLRYLINQRTASKRHLADIYELLRYTDYDEDRVIRMLDRLNMQRFTRRILAILAETFNLTEGFMPATALNDRKTRRLHGRLHQLQIL